MRLRKLGGRLNTFLFVTLQTTDVFNLRSCTVHVDNIKFFICPTNSHNSYKIVKLLKSFHSAQFTIHTHNRTEQNMQPQYG